MSFLLCSSQAIIRKAGANASATAIASGQLIADYYDQAEAIVNTATRYDWSTNIGSVKRYFSGALAHAVSSLAAMEVINYDMSGYSQIEEAQTMLDVLRDQAVRAIEVLKDEKNKEKMF